MKLCRFHLPAQGARLGHWVGEEIYDLTAAGQPHFATLTSLLQASARRTIATLLQDVDLSALPSYACADLDRAPDPAAPRGDSHWNVPEPELALVLNPQMQIVGYTVGNDVSSRDIEGENPLYLPQAKVYRHACALGPAITLAGEGVDAHDLAIRLTILRDSALAYQGETSTAHIHRSLVELVGYLARYQDFSCGAVLLTGTGIVPGDDLTLADGDVVSIEIESIGILRNAVMQM